MQLEMILPEPQPKPKELENVPFKINYRLKPSEIVSYLDKHVVGQESAKRELATALSNHLVLLYNNLNTDSKVKIKKNNLMLVGPTGSGKTFMLDLVCKFLGLPFTTIDINQFSASGYKGRNVEDIFTDICMAANGRDDRIPYSVVFIDEIDKQANTTSGENGYYDKKVQYDLLKIVEGYEYQGMDLTNILFVFGGSFDKIRMQEEQEQAKTPIGFGREEITQKTSGPRHITQQDMIAAGLIRELVGRIGQVIQLEPLTSEQFEHIVLNVNNSIKEQYDQIFTLRGINHRVTVDDAREIAAKAGSMGLGARALTTVANQHFQRYLYE